MIDPFDHIRRTVNIEEVARRYGLEINRQGKMLCPFHDDHKPSVSFKNNRYFCWVCSSKGSSIDLVAKLFDLEPLEAVKKISADFGLNLDFKGEYRPDTAKMQEIERERQLRDAFNNWIDKTYSDYAQLARYYWQNMQKYKPVNETDGFHPLYTEALHRWEPINHIMDILLKGTQEEKTALYKDLNRMEVKAG
ncbi:CHC2 zinc finger domain-containing protein [Acetobacterium wieringae]|uniref:CHC2 zinc finger domain-containing protein n=1 Tax=Acetobacterium wieringae TaxID=52694 RepID=UPI001D993575|nr:CHC2 zinc finger domain-containing protein [Acetobacterium wieringae]VUZ27414.1 DNA primase [Acetobacterium wieringae]